MRENNNYAMRGRFLIVEYVLLVGLFQSGVYLMFYFRIKTRLLL
jgi:hypothetical protein